MRDYKHRGRTVNYNSYPALGKLSAESIGTLGYTYARKNLVLSAVLEIRYKIARSEHNLNIAVLYPVSYFIYRRTRSRTLYIAQGDFGFRLLSYRKGFKNQRRVFHSAANQGHIYTHSLVKALAASTLYELAFGLRNTAKLKALYSYSEHFIISVKREYGEA